MELHWGLLDTHGHLKRCIHFSCMVLPTQFFRKSPKYLESLVYAFHWHPPPWIFLYIVVPQGRFTRSKGRILFVLSNSCFFQRSTGGPGCHSCKDMIFHIGQLVIGNLPFLVDIIVSFNRPMQLTFRRIVISRFS